MNKSPQKGKIMIKKNKSSHNLYKKNPYGTNTTVLNYVLMRLGESDNNILKNNLRPSKSHKSILHSRPNNGNGTPSSAMSYSQEMANKSPGTNLVKSSSKKQNLIINSNIYSLNKFNVAGRGNNLNQFTKQSFRSSNIISKRNKNELEALKKENVQLNKQIISFEVQIRLLQDKIKSLKLYQSKMNEKEINEADNTIRTLSVSLDDDDTEKEKKC